jgi:CheY-like chemotaxis protein
VPKILVADDNTNIQKMVSLAFEERGIDVVSVGNGEAAVRRIPDMNPDLVLADIFMPVRNGYEVCEFVKKDSRFSHVPVILLVGAFDPLDEKEARRVGADGVLKKPFVPPDPLIAMVISALEKNPKVAAEMAKAREMPPEPEPMPVVLEAPVKQEIKPLPEFPEPTPEEAALVYGFGSGKRGNEDSGADEKGPVSLDAEEAEEEESEGASSGHDWRRNAMDFEIPEETSKRTAFAMEEDATAMFPSEKVVPPKHVRAQEPAPLASVAATQILPVTPVAPMPPIVPMPPVAASATPLAAPAKPKTEAFVPPVAPAASAPILAAPKNDEPPEPHDSFLTAAMLRALPKSATLPAEPEPAQAPRAASIPVAEAKSPLAKVFEAKVAEPKIATTPTAKTPAPAPEIPALEIEPSSEPTPAARPSHWMDAMTAALKEPEPEEDQWADPEPPVKLDLDAKQPAASPLPSMPAPSPLAPTPAAAGETPELVSSEELPVLYAEPPSEEENEAFLAEQSGASEPLPLVSVDQEPKSTHSDPALETTAPVAVGHLNADPELVAEPEQSGPIAKDPALVEPPAVHVTPEPLLVEEGPDSAASQYEKREESTAAPFEFAEAAEASDTQASARAEVEQPAEPETVASERIPTGPPPSREVLAEIPFLTPPPEFLRAAAEDAKPAADSDVDAVVQKVLEKLEPQLHNLLSQGLLKPLVENIIQNEVAKKGR